MTVISISIIESTEQIVSGIPRSVSISANLPSTIFYTLDGTDPTLFSTIYTSAIQLPTDNPVLVLKVFATDGTNSSAIITNTYETDVLNKNVRFPHSGTDAQPNSIQAVQNLAPFGSSSLNPTQHFLGPAAAGLTVNDPSLPQVSTGFDGNGNETGFTNGQPTNIPTPGFPFLYSETNAEGQRGFGIGTLPPNKVIFETPPPEQSEIGSPMFDPRALVIIQDLTSPPDPTVPPHINRMFFTLEDVEHTREGNQFFNSGLDAPPVSGGFLRQHYNPTNNTMTYYYFDSTQNRWIQSTVPFTPKSDQYNYASKTVLRRGGMGAARVFEWKAFKASYLY
jgi:Chitobiase/beta-hexosaminidase C-terminal domain